MLSSIVHVLIEYHTASDVNGIIVMPLPRVNYHFQAAVGVGGERYDFEREIHEYG